MKYMGADSGGGAVATNATSTCTVSGGWGVRHLEWRSRKEGKPDERVMVAES